MTDVQTDEGAMPQTDVVQGGDIPQNDVVEAESKTRAEKAAEKHGLTVDEFRELKSTKGITEQLSKLDTLAEAVQPLIQELEAKKRKADFEANGLDGLSFDDFDTEYQALVGIGADPQKAKDLAISRLKEKSGYVEETERANGRNQATLPPEGTGVAHPSTITKTKLGNLPQEDYTRMYSLIKEGKVQLVHR